VITQNAVGKSTLPSCRLLLKWSLMKRTRKKVPRARKANFSMMEESILQREVENNFDVLREINALGVEM